MAKPTSQWACTVILLLMSSTFTMAHVVKHLKPPNRPNRSRKLLMDKNDQPETNNFQGSDSDGEDAQDHHSQVDTTEAIASGCSVSLGGKGLYGGGHGSGGTYIGFRNIFPFFGFPFGGIVPQIITWGEGGGYGGANKNPGMGVNCQCQNPGMGVNCQCTHNGVPVHYVVTPVYFQPPDTAPLNDLKEDGPGDIAPGPSGN